MYASFADFYDTIFPCSPTALELIQGFSSPTSRILELGCGTGALLKNVKAQRAVGLDIEPALIAKAKAHKDAHGAGPTQKATALEGGTTTLERPEFICAELLDFGPSQPEASFELVFSLGNVVSHLEPQHFIKWLEEIHRLLVPGGRWIFHVIYWDDILNQTQYNYPPLKRGEYIFNRSYGDISEQSLSFQSCLTQGERTVFEQKQILVPHRFAFLMQIHHRFNNLSVWADYAKNPQGGISRVVVMQRAG